MVKTDVTCIYPGDRLKDVMSNQEYRVLAVCGDVTTVCLIDEPHHSKLIIRDIDTVGIIRSLHTGELIKINDPETVISINNLSDNEKEKYQKRLAFVTSLQRIYGPTWKRLTGKAAKPEYEALCKNLYISKRQAKKWVNKYIQSGCKKESLLSSAVSNPKRFERIGEKKNGRKNIQGNPETGVALSSYTIESFEHGLDIYRNGYQDQKKTHHTTTMASAFRLMLIDRYNELAVTGKGEPYVIVPQNMRPTYRQFTYYCSKHLGKEERDTIKTSAREVRNDKRLLPSDTVRNSMGPMDIVEIDAWEADVDLLSATNQNLVVGRPTVYAMVDTYSKMIVAVSISFDRDSFVGLTNLFLNLADPLDEQVKNLGLSFDYNTMPTGFLPNIVRTDNGSDFVSNDFIVVLNKLGIMHEIVPAATGSLKPNVERLWGRIRELTEKALENHGVILKRNDNNSKDTAVLNVREYAAIIYTAAVGLNRREIINYPAREDMLTYKDEFGQPLRFRPDALWKYGVEKYMAPRTIQNKSQYYLDLMKVETASYSRDGITFKELPYWPKEDDQEMLKRLYEAGTRRIKIEVHMDPRSVNYLWYVDEKNILHTFVLNTSKTEALDMANKTFWEYGEYLKLRRQARAAAYARNVEVDTVIQASAQAITEMVVDGKKASKGSTKNIRENHEAEKNETRHANAISQRLGEETKLPIKDADAVLIPAKKEISDEYEIEDMDSFIDDLWGK